MVAAEALVRLVDCEGRLIYPDLFIDRAENSDLMVPLGRAVVEQVCADLADSADRGAAWQRVAINLSGNQLNADTGLPDFIDQLVASHGLLHDVLEFELTERQQLLPDSAGMGVLKALARRGSRLVLDDFGMGYSSYTYLSLPGLPISAFKLDRTLVRRLPDDRASQAIVSSLLDLAAALELEVVAEGVENDAQNAYLENSGCSHAQGYRFARPMGIADLQDFIAMQGLSDHGNLRA
jgi:EAL domain-containing protein (putative c-di-GMP-specific phosphodiesterase class I)